LNCLKKYDIHFKSKDELFEEILNSYVIYPLREFERYISNVEGDIFNFLPAFFNSYVYMIDEMVKLVGSFLCIPYFSSL
jgi:AcrR family transcriptional regulator